MENPLCSRCVASRDVRRSLFWVNLWVNGLDMKRPQSMQTYCPEGELHLFRLRFKARQEGSTCFKRIYALRC
jgi:hypothetical protein